ncbi:HPr family phosphocarrier protein [Bacillus canaveralius]|uniref:HPr family phosphocarrier protein n=1 Tax=Bacillus canaveralius TaxID=1403243 RepID=A0A2N5GHU9_9BACI|nr:HPr family phosphocarrier protein [Bacillus canaveralius]PLR80353.1 HPr family phosphocarrier protein [Bacillus canaveralius]PLR95428.1 HPr family phosphocarrier protein [Bacillus canaveralius]
MIEKQFEIITTTGFARPATLLVSVACMFTSKIVLEYQGKSVDLKNSPKSIMDVMSLEIRPGAEFNIRAEGIDENQALQSVEDHLSKMKLIKE